MEIVLLVGARPYTLPEPCAVILRDRIREYAGNDRMLDYLADAISEDIEQGECPEPLDLDREQIEALADLLFGASAEKPLDPSLPAVRRSLELRGLARV